MTSMLPITKIPASGLPTSAIVVGDPARAAAIAEELDDAEQVGGNREYVTFRGRWRGTELVVASHGVGGPGAICCFQELADAGVTTMIRLGTAGAMTPALATGDLVVAEAAVRDDGVTDQLLPASYPAVCAPEVVLALSDVAARRGPYHRGLVWTRAAFYPGHLPLATDAYIESQVIAIEMELSALLVLASMRRLRAGGLLVIDGVSADDEVYDPHTDEARNGVVRATQVCLDAIHRLASA